MADVSTTSGDHRLVAIGGPGRAHVDAGSVRIEYADTDTGKIDSTHAGNHTLTVAGAVNFGRALETADVRDSSGWPLSGGGQELLVGAPGIEFGGNGGAVYWYLPSKAAGPLMVYGGLIANPTLYDDAEFGYAIAAADAALDAASPWERAGVSWVAIGAPGRDAVHVFSVDPSLANPFTLVQTLTPTVLGQRFGQAMVVDDFDGDGLMDLAVGAPASTAGIPDGQVYVFAGQSGSQPLNGTALFVAQRNAAWSGLSWGHVDANCSMSSAYPDRFGQSLAAARRSPGSPASDLLVGAPGFGSDDGAVYTISVVGGAGVPTGCATNPDIGSGASTAGDEWGAALSTGNFASVDGRGSVTSPEALLRDVAVGRPGWSGDAGRVDVYFMDAGKGLDTSNVVSEIYSFSGASSGRRFGKALDAHYVQETQHADLLVGEPDNLVAYAGTGAASLTKAMMVSPLSCMVDGTYKSTDSRETGYNRDISMGLNGDNELQIEFLSKFRLTLVDSAGATCSSLGVSSTGLMPESTVLNLGAACPGSFPHTFSGVDVGAQLASLLTETQWSSLSNDLQAKILAMEADVVLDFVASTTCPDGSGGLCSTAEVELIFNTGQLQDAMPGAFSDCIYVKGAPYLAYRTEMGVCED